MEAAREDENLVAVLLPTHDLTADIAVLEDIGFTLTAIFPADDPRVAKLTGHGLMLEINTEAKAQPAGVRIPGLAAPVRTSAAVEFSGTTSEWPMPDLESAYVHTSGGSWGVGRAGLEYRDLLPHRHGGRVIASHIRIVEPGPVPDYVHHHDIAFQMIYCRRGRVEVVYEDQGDSFWMNEGDFVLQPPHIRHRVLSSAQSCEVVEIAAPAEHPTFIDNELTLPTPTVDPQRTFGGQRFCFNRATDLDWNSLDSGWEEQTNGFAKATNGLATVRILRRASAPGPVAGTSSGDLCFFFVLDGTAEILTDGNHQTLEIDDSLAVKQGSDWVIEESTPDFRCLQVELGDTSSSR